MSAQAWIEAFDRKHKPGIEQIRAFLPAEVGALFEEFSKYVAREFGVHCSIPTYTQQRGWVYRFERNSVRLIHRVSMERDAFVVEDIRVSDRESFGEAIALADRLYADGFAERFQAITAEKNARQAERTRQRVAREREQLAQLESRIDKPRFNRYRWSPKVSRADLKRLYALDAKGLPDSELLDKIGYTLYARCLQGRDERALLNRGRLRCHHCGVELQCTAMAALIECPCGYQYIVRDYMRAFRRENMPSGAASAIFNRFIDDWPCARTDAEKMRLIDGLIHEFHINLQSGVKGRFVGVNLIEGNKAQIQALILDLAYGDTAQAFQANLERK